MFQDGSLPTLKELLTCENEIKDLDKQLLNLYHLLEDMPLSAPSLVKAAVKIRDVRRKRRYWREVKNLKNAFGMTKEAATVANGFKNAVKDRKENYKKKSIEGLKAIM